MSEFAILLMYAVSAILFFNSKLLLLKLSIESYKKKFFLDKLRMLVTQTSENFIFLKEELYEQR